MKDAVKRAEERDGTIRARLLRERVRRRNLLALSWPTAIHIIAMCIRTVLHVYLEY